MSNTSFTVLTGVLLYVFGLFVGLSGGYKTGIRQLRIEAVERGHAEYVAKDGNIVFQWKGEK